MKNWVKIELENSKSNIFYFLKSKKGDFISLFFLSSSSNESFNKSEDKKHSK